MSTVRIRHPEDTALFDAIALWDTGSTFSGISHELAERIGLAARDAGPSETAGGKIVTVDYFATLLLAEDFCFPCVHMLEFPSAAGFDVIIGMDIISGGNLLISNRNNRTMLRFEYPAFLTQGWFHNEI